MRLLRRVDHQAPLANIVRRGFFDVDMLAGVAAENRRRAVPMIRGGDDNRIHILVVEHSAHITDELRGRFLVFA